MDPKSIEREIVLELVHLQHPKLGVQLQWHRKATRVLHHQVLQGKGHRQGACAPARAYAMKAVEDTDAPDVIVSNFTIFDIIVHALIDPRSTHSYICTDIPNLGNLSRSETEYEILVTNPLGHSVIVNKVYRDCPIRI